MRDKERVLEKFSQDSIPALLSTRRVPLGLQNTWRIWGVARRCLPHPWPVAAADTRLDAESLGHQTVKIGPCTSAISREWAGAAQGAWDTVRQ